MFKAIFCDILTGYKFARGSMTVLIILERSFKISNSECKKNSYNVESITPSF